MPIERYETLTGGQSELLNQALERLSTMMSEGLGVGPAGVLTAGEGTLTEALQGISPEYMAEYFRTNIQPQLDRQFEEQVIPQLREEMIATGDFWGTGRVDIIEDARQKQAERVQAQMANWMRWGREQATGALSQVEGIAGAGQRLELERVGATLPFINTPTQLAIGEPKVDARLADALASAATGGGGGGGRVGGGFGGGVLGGARDPYGISAARDPITYGGIGGGGRGTTRGTAPVTSEMTGVSTLGPGGGADLFGPSPVVDAGAELPGIGEGTMFDRPISGVPKAGGKRRAYSGFLHEDIRDPSTWGTGDIISWG